MSDLDKIINHYEPDGDKNPYALSLPQIEQIKENGKREVWEKMKVKCLGYKYWQVCNSGYKCDYQWMETKNPEPCKYETCPILKTK